MNQRVIGVFKTSRQALQAKNTLVAAGFGRDVIREQADAYALLPGRGGDARISYADTLARGDSLIAVDATNSQGSSRAEAILRMSGAIALDAFEMESGQSKSRVPAKIENVQKRRDQTEKTSWFQRGVALVKNTFALFSAQRAASRGAALSFYTVTSIAPILVIVIAVAGFVFGREAASGAIFQQFSGLMGAEGADVLQMAIASASNPAAGTTAAIVSVITLILSASGVFLELEDALNAIWDAKPQEGIWSMARARIASVGLVIALGFLLMVSLMVDTALKALSGFFPFGATLLLVVSTLISLAFMTGLTAAIFKFLPAKPIAWRDVWMGAAVTAVMFEIGKFLIGLYLGLSSTASSLGAAGGLLALLFWVYYSAQIFLLGAAFTKVSAEQPGAPAYGAPLKSSEGKEITSNNRAARPAYGPARTVAAIAGFLLIRAVARRFVLRGHAQSAGQAHTPAP